MNKKFEAYWLNPHGAIIGIHTTHIDYITSHPSIFNTTKNAILKLYKRFGERLGQEGDAREKLMIGAIKKGWIRIRYTDRHGWIAQTYSMDKKDKENIWDFVVKMIKTHQDGKYADIIITSIKPSGQIMTSFEDVVKGKLYTEAEYKEKEKIIKETMNTRVFGNSLYLTDIIKSI